MAKKEWAKVEQSTLRQTVWRSIRDAILTSEISPGSQINQAVLADEFGISRGPLREALSLLEEEGLVVNIPYRGTFVAKLDIQVIEDTYSLREVLELFAVERAIARRTPEQLAVLRSIFDAMNQASSMEHIREFYREDLAFHRQLNSMAGHDLLMEMWKMIEANVQRGIFFGTFKFQVYTTCELIEEHRRILEAVEAGDVETAKRAISLHIREGFARLKARWEIVEDQ